MLPLSVWTKQNESSKGESSDVLHSPVDREMEADSKGGENRISFQSFLRRENLERWRPIEKRSPGPDIVQAQDISSDPIYEVTCGRTFAHIYQAQVARDA